MAKSIEEALFNLAKRIENMPRGKTYNVEAELKDIESLVNGVVGKNFHKSKNSVDERFPKYERSIGNGRQLVLKSTAEIINHEHKIQRTNFNKVLRSKYEE